MGMGLFVVPAFGTIIAAVSDAETGSASGTLNALQQLGSGIGVAVLGTIFFSVLGHEGFSQALRHALWWQVAGLGALLLVSPLLPATAAAAAAAAIPGDPGAADPGAADRPSVSDRPAVAHSDSR
jgi:hypothetical protein